MKDEWPHDNYAAPSDQTIHGLRPRGPRRDFIFAEDAESVSSWNDAERPVVSAGVVEVHAERYNSFQGMCRCVSIVDSLLHRPRSPTRSLSLVA